MLFLEQFLPTAHCLRPMDLSFNYWPLLISWVLKNSLTKNELYDRKQKTKSVSWLLWIQKKELKF